MFHVQNVCDPFENAHETQAAACDTRTFCRCMRNVHTLYMYHQFADFGNSSHIKTEGTCTCNSTVYDMVLGIMYEHERTIKLSGLSISTSLGAHTHCCLATYLARLSRAIILSAESASNLTMPSPSSMLISDPISPLLGPVIPFT